MIPPPSPASTDTQTNYACNGKAFVYVKGAISADANKAWLEIPASANGARQLKIVFADATTSIHNSQFTIDNGDWYDLNGRKLDKMPTKEGVLYPERQEGRSEEIRSLFIDNIKNRLIMKRKTKLLRWYAMHANAVHLEMWATDFTVDVKCGPLWYEIVCKICG